MWFGETIGFIKYLSFISDVYRLIQCFLTLKIKKLLSDVNVTNSVCLFFPVQLRGEAFGSTWQFSEAFTRRNLDKNVHPWEGVHEGQGKGNVRHRQWLCFWSLYKSPVVPVHVT